MDPVLLIKTTEKGLLSESHETSNGQDTAMLLGFFCEGKLRAQELVIRDTINFLQEMKLNREQFVQTR